MSPQWIEIDEDVMALIKAEAEPFVDNPNRALRRLLGLPPADHGEEALARWASPPVRVQRGRAPSTGLLPQRAYEPAILRALAEWEGWAPRRTVVAAVGEALMAHLTDLDRASLQSGKPRWETRVDQARLELLRRGLMKEGSPRGVWELAEAGAAELRRLEAEAADGKEALK